MRCLCRLGRWAWRGASILAHECLLDTRDMVAEGLTSGSVDRDALHRAGRGGAGRGRAGRGRARHGTARQGRAGQGRRATSDQVGWVEWGRVGPCPPRRVAFIFVFVLNYMLYFNVRYFNVEITIRNIL